MMSPPKKDFPIIVNIINVFKKYDAQFHLQATLYDLFCLEPKEATEYHQGVLLSPRLINNIKDMVAHFKYFWKFLSNLFLCHICNVILIWRGIV